MPEIAEAGLRLAIYARVSTRSSGGANHRLASLRTGAVFPREMLAIVGIYKDEGWSGGFMERPELDRLRDDAQKAVFDAVLINDVDV